MKSTAQGKTQNGKLLTWVRFKERRASSRVERSLIGRRISILTIFCRPGLIILPQTFFLTWKYDRKMTLWVARIVFILRIFYIKSTISEEYVNKSNRKHMKIGPKLCSEHLLDKISRSYGSENRNLKLTMHLFFLIEQNDVTKKNWFEFGTEIRINGEMLVMNWIPRPVKNRSTLRVSSKSKKICSLFDIKNMHVWCRPEYFCLVT